MEELKKKKTSKKGFSAPVKCATGDPSLEPPKAKKTKIITEQEVSTNDNLKNSYETTKTKPHKEKNQTFGVKKNEKSKPDRSLEKKEKKKKVPKVHEHQNKEEKSVIITTENKITEESQKNCDSSVEQKEEKEQVQDLDLRKEEARPPNTEPRKQEYQSSLHTEHEEKDRSTTISEQKHVEEVETFPKKITDDSKNASAQTKCKTKRPPLPVRSLSDEEYEEIFKNAISRVMDTPFDELMVSLQRKDCNEEHACTLLSDNQIKGCEQSFNQKKIQKPKKVPKMKPVKSTGSSSSTDVQEMEPDVEKPVPNETAKILQDRTKNNTESDSKCSLKTITAFDITKDTLEPEEDKENTKDALEMEKNKENASGTLTSDQNKENVPNKVIKTNSMKEKKFKTPSTKKGFTGAKKQSKTAVTPYKVKIGSPHLQTEKVKKQKSRPKQQNDNVQKKKNINNNVHKSSEEKLQKKNDRQNEKKSEEKVDRKRRMMDRDLLQYGTWVQCCNSSCKKWRYLSDVNDPSELPDDWFCTMNKDQDYNECDKAEQEYNEEEHIYTNYTEGTVVWARMSGFPWWPAMIEMDPDTEYFFELANPETMFPSYYHVVFFDERVSRAWVRSSCIQPFIGKENLNSLTAPKKSKIPSYKSEIAAAKAKACSALQLDLQERLKSFSFCQRYKGKWGKDESVSKDHENKPSKPKHAKRSRKVTSKTKVEVVDDTTVDDLLNNPSSLLSSLDDVLDSLESFTDDSDFVLSGDEEIMEDDGKEEEEENIGTLQKEITRHKEHTITNKELRSRSVKAEKQDQEGSELEPDIKISDTQHASCSVTKSPLNKLTISSKALKSEDNTELSELSETDSESDFQNEQDVEKETSGKFSVSTGPNRQLKLDPDVFTMEMHSEEESQEEKCVDMSRKVVNEEIETQEPKDETSQVASKPVLQKKQTPKNKFSAKLKKNPINIDHAREIVCSPKSDSAKSVDLDTDDLPDQGIKQETDIKEEELFFSPKSDPQEQAVPNAESDFRQAEDLDLELSLDFDTIPKHEPVISVSAGIQAVNEADEDSDPFELIEE